MKYILNSIYLGLLFCYLPVILYQRWFKGKKRPGIWSKFIGQGPVRTSGQKRVLFHAVSLGEVNAIRKLVSEFCNRFPDWEVVVSTTTQTGLEAAQKHFPHLETCLLPFDFSWSVRRFLSNLKPNLLVLAELEIWPNLIAECRSKSIGTAIVNARLNQRSTDRYRRFSFLFSRVFQQLDLVCCQNSTYSSRFQDLGIQREKIAVTGNLKYDALQTDRNHSEIQRLRSLIDVKKDEMVWIAGSTQTPEEEIVLDAFQELRKEYSNLRLLICPRHPERFDEVFALIKNAGISVTRRSELGDSHARSVPIEQVVLLDCMGELGHWWGVGDLAFVGGSFGNRGGQNMIEPVALGNAVCFGPNTRNFASEVILLKQHEAAVQLEDREQLLSFLKKCLADSSYRCQLVGNGIRFLEDQVPTGESANESAWGLTLASLEPLMGDSANQRDNRAA